MAVADVPISAATAELIPLGRIHSEGNVRRSLGNVEPLAQSISRHGVLTAVTVTRRDDGDYDLIAGFRRVAAARVAGLEVIPAVIRTVTDEAETLRARLAENVDREGLSDLDQGEAIQQLLGLGVSVDDVAATVQTRPENVQAWADLPRLPKKIRSLIGKGRLTAQDAYPLVTLLDDAQTMRAAIKHIDDGWSVDRAVTIVTRDREQERALAAAAEKLQAEGCRIIDAPQWGQFASNSRIQKLGSGGVTVPLSKHAKLPCHAAYIWPHAASHIVYVCTDRNLHAGAAGSGVPDLKAERAAKRAAKKALRGAQATRFTALCEAVRNHSVSTEEAKRHVLQLALGDASARDLGTAWAILGLPEPQHEVYRPRAVYAHAAKDSQSLLDVVFAIALARGERALGLDNWDTRGGLVARHVSLIRAAGIHEFSATEEQLIAERSSRVWEDEGEAAHVDEEPGEEAVEGAA